MMTPVRMISFHLVLSLLVGASLVAGGCKQNYPYKTCTQLPKTNVPVEAVPLRPGDQIVVQVPRMEELAGNEPFTVNADGTIVLPLVGVLQVEGLTAEAAARKLNARLNGIIVDPAARISVVSPRMPVVAVVGEVRSPGRFDVAHDEGILRVLAQAGGLTEFADTKSIYVVRKYPTRERIRFDYDELVGGTACSTDFVLQDGDVIVVE
jgi:polysaccharide export outer membrane protein